MKSEDILIKKFQAGNGVAFKEIFERYYLPVKSYAFRYVENSEITEDFVQDAFFRVWEKRKDFSFLPAVTSFLYLSVRNACLDYLRHQQVQRRNESELVMWYTEEGEQEFLMEEEIHAMIYNAIKDLSARSRQVVILTMKGCSNSEIAEKMDITINSVKTIKLRAYRILRERLRGIQWLLLFFFGI